MAKQRARRPKKTTELVATESRPPAESPQAQVIPADQSLIGVIERAAQSPDVDVEKMERLMAMHERITKQYAETAFNSAMNEVQSELKRVAANAENPQTHSTYATYAALDRILRPIYTKYGFSLSFDTGPSPELAVLILCHVSHKAGHTRTYQAVIPADGKGARGGDVMTKTHAVGSAMSYGMRYLLKLIFNIAIGQDDDGNAASLDPITEQQVAALKALAEEVKADVPKFLAYLGKMGKVNITSITDIPAVMYQSAVAALEHKRRAL
jgi:hypothetical protein